MFWHYIMQSMGLFHFWKKAPKRIYLDYAANAPVLPEVRAVMEPWLTEHYGNPSAIHKEGARARDAIEMARQSVARAFRVPEEGVVYTSGGTEANNLAITGSVEALRKEGKDYADLHIITTKIEHPSILRTLEMLEERGVYVSYVDVDEEGRIDRSSLEEHLRKETVLVTFAYVNSEIGTVQEVKHITRSVKKWNTEMDTDVRVHLDASQAPLWLRCSMDSLGVHLMTLDGGKCGGPAGSGALLLGRGVKVAPVLHGGSQEGGRRGGTENTASILGCSHALVRAQEGFEKRSERVARIRDAGIELLLNEVPGAVLNGPRENRVANNINISLPGYDSEFAVVTLDTHGVAASTKSACGGADGSGSHVVRTVTGDEKRANATIRLSLGEETALHELRSAAHILKEYVARMRDVVKNIDSGVL